MLPKAREVLYLNINLHFGLAQKKKKLQNKNNPPKTPNTSDSETLLQKQSNRSFQVAIFSPGT